MKTGAMVHRHRMHFESVEEYREHKEGQIASRFDVAGIRMRIRNVAGAGGLRGFRNADVSVLDEFRRTRAVTTSVRSPEFRAELLKQLHDKDITITKRMDIIRCCASTV